MVGYGITIWTKTQGAYKSDWGMEKNRICDNDNNNIAEMTKLVDYVVAQPSVEYLEQDT